MNIKQKSICWFLLLCSISTLYSCNNHSITSNDSFSKEIKIDFKSTSDVDFDSIMEYVGFIKLETNQDCLIGKISKLIVTNNAFIVVDKSIGKSIYVFNKDGSFRTRISRNGRGPKEYLDISDVAAMDDRVYILDNENGRILIFDINGNYIDKISNVPWYHSIELMDSCSFLAFDLYNQRNLNKSVIYQDFSGKVNYAFGKNCYSRDFTFTRENNLYRFYNGVYGTLNFENTIFKFTRDSVNALYKIVTNPSIVDCNDFKSNSSFDEQTKKSGYFNGNLIITEDLILFRLFSTDYNNPLCVYYKQKDYSLIINEVTHIPVFILWSFPIASSNNHLYHVVSASHACNLREVLSKNEVDEPLDSIFAAITADSNPIILITKITCPYEK